MQYSMPEQTMVLLTGLVQSIEENPGRLLDPSAFAQTEALLDVHKVVRMLPEGLTIEDLVGIVRLAMLTESGTDLYARVFYEGAKLYEADWLQQFIQRVWAPDELTHRVPFKLILMKLGFSEAELDRDMRYVQEQQYEHCCGKTPVALTAYGIIQEYLTDNWYRLLWQLLRVSAPSTAFMVVQVKVRETLHRWWYTKMTALQIEGQPELLHVVAEAIVNFTMPGKKFIPEQTRATEWLPRMGADFHGMAKDFVMHFSEVAGTMRRRGELLVAIAAKKGYKVGPLSPSALKPFLRFGGYGLLGEAMLERVGLPIPPPETVIGRMRAQLRTQLTRRINLGMIGCT